MSMAYSGIQWRCRGAQRQVPSRDVSPSARDVALSRASGAVPVDGAESLCQPSGWPRLISQASQFLQAHFTCFMAQTLALSPCVGTTRNVHKYLPWRSVKSGVWMHGIPERCIVRCEGHLLPQCTKVVSDNFMKMS